MFVYEPSGCGFVSSCSHLNFRYAIILSQPLVNADFFTSGIGPDILMNVVEDYMYILFLGSLGFV